LDKTVHVSGTQIIIAWLSPIDKLEHLGDASGILGKKFEVSRAAELHIMDRITNILAKRPHISPENQRALQKRVDIILFLRYTEATSE
jgi:hypothetical protein